MTKNSQKQDIIKIIKRLVIIKSLISLEEEEDILEQLNKLKEYQIDEEVEVILKHIKQHSYAKATALIEKYINKYNQITFYIDPEIEALRFEAKSLEKQTQELNNEKNELNKLIHDFNKRHNQELGELIIKLLQYRKEESKGTLEYEEAEKEYDEFYTNYEASKGVEILTLTIEEQKELKVKYRKASKLCHPDIVDEGQKEFAHKIFIELNKAYERNDLKRVSEILNNLEQGKQFSSKADLTNEKMILQLEIERLRIRLVELSEEIIAIKTSDTYEKIISITDWDYYFSKTKKELQEQLDLLK